VEYLIHPVLLVKGPTVTIPLYVGFGAGMGSWKNGYWGYGDGVSNLNVHVPLGLAFQFHPLPIDIFFQIEPGIGLVPYFAPSIGATLGARIFF